MFHILKKYYFILLYKAKQPIFKKPFGTTDALLMNEKFQSSKSRYIYCKKSHWSDECRTVSTLPARKEKVKGKCYICLQPGHLKINCKVINHVFPIGQEIFIIAACAQAFLEHQKPLQLRS